MKSVLAWIALWVVLIGCTERPASPLPDPGYDYFPLETGLIRVYEVSEITYALSQPAQTRTYRLRETIRPPYTDAGGQSVYPVERAVMRSSGAWEIDSVWSAWRTVDRAISQENGLTLVKLAFPTRNRSRWDANLYNPMPAEFRTIESSDVPRTLGALDFAKTLTVVQQNDSTLLSLRRRRDLYAEGVGLVQQERVSVQYCGTPDCVGKGIIDFGLARTVTLTSFSR